VVVQGRVGEYVTIARRSGETWFVGTITNREGRTLNIPLSFLDDGTYEATIYADGPNAHSVTNPTAMEVSETTATLSETLRAELASGGGQAVKLSPVE
jgi:alpha-glucosidase